MNWAYNMEALTKNKKGFKNTKVGWIPEDWEVNRISNLSNSITSGSTPLRSMAEYFDNGIIYWVKTTDLNNGDIITSEEKITKYALSKTSLRILPINTVLIAMYGGFNQIGRTGLLKIESAINQALSAIKTDVKLLDPEYLIDWLNYGVGYWKRYAASSRKDPNITKRDVKDYIIAHPKVKEQKAIATCLSTWDKAIETQTKLIAQKELRKKGLMQQLLTGDKRLIGFDGIIEYKKLRSFLKEISNRNKNGDVSRILSVTNSRGFINQSEQFERIVASKDLSNYKIIRKGQFAYNPSRVNVGSLDLLEKFDNGLLSPMYVIFKTDNKTLLDKFLYYQLKTWWFKGHISQYVQGSVRESLAFEGLKQMSFFIPDIKEQIAIVKILQTGDKEIKLLNKKLDQIKKQKKGLMQQLLTGKIRVKMD